MHTLPVILLYFRGTTEGVNKRKLIKPLIFVPFNWSTGVKICIFRVDFIDCFPGLLKYFDISLSNFSVVVYHYSTNITDPVIQCL